MTPDAANAIFLALVLVAAVLGLVLLAVITVGLERGLEERRGDARQGGRGSEKGFPR